MTSTAPTTAPIAGLLTAAEFAMLPSPPDGSKQELVKGQVQTMPPPGFFHGLIQLALGAALRMYVQQHQLGRVTVESGVLTDNGPDTVRGPDVAYWSYERLPADQMPLVYANVAPDLVAEVASPSNTRKQLATKIREYFTSGVRLVWILDPEDRTVTIYTQAGNGIVLWDDTMLTGGDVLPGFSCPVASLFN